SPVASAHARVWKYWHSASRGSACQSDLDHLGGKLHHPRTCFVLCSNTRDRRRVVPDSPAPLSGGRNGAFRMDLWRTPHSRSDLECSHSAFRCFPGHARETDCHDRSCRKYLAHCPPLQRTRRRKLSRFL